MDSVRSFRQVLSTISTRSCSTFFAVGLPGQLSVSFVPRYNRLDNVSDSLLELFFVNYYEVCLICFHSQWQFSAEAPFYQHAVKTVRGFLASFPWVPCGPWFAWFLVPLDSEQRIRTFRWTDTRYFCSESCNAKTKLQCQTTRKKKLLCEHVQS